MNVVRDGGARAGALLRMLLSTALLVVVLGVLASPRGVMASEQVTSLEDIGEGSLRDAIYFASSGDTITFAPGLTGTIVLNLGPLVIDKHLTIDGPGADVIAVSGNNASRVFEIDGGVSVTLDGLTITQGRAGTRGGGIYNIFSNLTISNSIISNSQATSGGGIYSSAGILTLTDSAVNGNSASNSGGGVNNGSGSRVTITDSSISGNTGTYSGGLFNSGTMTLSSSSVTNNVTPDAGGAVLNSGTGTIVNSTISGNSANVGGGIYNAGTLRVASSTLSGNSASSGVDGIFSNNSIALFGTILADSGSNCDLSYTVSDNGYNLATDNSCAFTTGTSLSSADPKLHSGGLRDNGGPTQTIGLLNGSPAIDVIPVANCLDPDGIALTTDQRGEPRPDGDACDIGAFEGGLAPDTTAPIARNPKIAALTGSAPNGTLLIRLTWSGSDDIGVTGYQLQTQTNGGVWVSQYVPGIATSKTLRITIDSTVRMRVRPFDAAGNLGVWKVSAPFTTAVIEAHADAMTYSSGWTNGTIGNSIDGLTKKSSTARSIATVLFQGSSISWVSARNSQRGKAVVSIDGVYITTVDLYRATNSAPTVVFTYNGLNPSGTHSLRVRVLGTKYPDSDGTTVVIDHFIVGGAVR